MRDRALGTTVRLQFSTHNPDGGGVLVAPSSALTTADIRIYKDGSATEKATTNGLTVTSPFDSVTGLHLLEIDTSNSTGDTGFWASGSVYHVRLVTAKTAGGYSLNGCLIGEFSLELQTADIRKANGTAITASSGRMEVNTTHWGGTAVGSANVLIDGAITAAKIATDAITAAKIASDAVTEIQAGLSTLDAAAVRTAIGLASANIDTQLAGINAKTTNLPSDPADASDIAAAFATVNSTLATIAGYLDTEIAAIKAKTDTLPASPASETTLSALSGKLAGITLLKNWLAVIMGKVADTTTRAEVNATTAGATYNETTDSLEAIRDRGDAAWTTGGGGGGGDATAANQTTIINHLTDIKGAGWSSTTDTLEKIRDVIAAALDSVIASVGVTPGALTGWPETMSIGDSYTDDCSRSVHLFVRDANDDPITSIGSHAFTDADFTATIILSQGAQRGRVIGTATWEVGPEGYLNVQIPSKESRRAAEGTATVQVLLRWTDSGDQYTLPATTTRWIAQL